MKNHEGLITIEKVHDKTINQRTLRLNEFTTFGSRVCCDSAGE